MPFTDNEDGTLVNSHFARVSETPDLPVNMRRAEFDDQKPLCDPSGQLWVLASSVVPGFSPLIEQALSGGSFVSTALISPTAAQNVAFAGFNSNPTDLMYVQIHDRTTIPVLGTVPDIIIPVPSLGAFSYSLPISFSAGIAIGISTTALTFTAAGSPYMSYSILFRDAV